MSRSCCANDDALILDDLTSVRDTLEELVDYPVSVRYEILVLRDLSAKLVLAPLQIFVQDEMSVRKDARVKHARLLLTEEPLILAKQLREGGESFSCIAHGVLFRNGRGI